MKMKLSEELTWRGFINQTTFDDVKQLDRGVITFYFGVDPSSDSMTIGNLATAMMIRHFINHGHHAILLVGGATGMIGDPDGKKQERKLKTLEEIDNNKRAIAEQYKIIFAGQQFEIVDNFDWFRHINFLSFLRDVGKHVPMRTMLGREFVQARLGKDGTGISYAEFSYSLIQGYDFLHLFREKGVTLQLCGADQWGNSIAGVDLIRRITGSQAHVLSAPLIIDKNTGAKFGKSEEGAIWLDARKTSVFKFYQFWLNIDDASALDFLKIYTLLGRNEIEQIITEFNKNRASRLAQKKLAYEVTSLIHGKDAADYQVEITNILFGDKTTALDDARLKTLEAEFPTVLVPRRLSSDKLIDIILKTGLATSKTEARRFLHNGAIYINNMQLKTELEFWYEMHSDYAIIRRGRNTLALLKSK